MYQVLARFYDRLQEVDYESFADYYQAVFARFGIQPKLVLDLGCGTGNVTLPMARRGYEMIGLDASVEMLELAAEKARAQGQDILFLNQDMTDFELYGTVDAMVCALDGVNYLTEDGQLKAMLRLLHYYLAPGGLLIFDVNTPYQLREVLDGQSFVYDREEVYCVWSSDFDPDTQRCGFQLDFFLPGPDGRYTRQSEYQEERAYTPAQLRAAIEDCGLECAGMFADRSFQPPRPDTARLFVVVKRP